LKKTFDARIGPAMPADDGTHQAEVKQFFDSPANRTSMGLWNAGVDKATNRLDGAINLWLFDDREKIVQEIEAAIATVK
jgi:hypothetical protein